MEMNLKVWELLVSALTPAAIALAGYFINKAIKTSLCSSVCVERAQRAGGEFLCSGVAKFPVMTV